MRHRRLTIWGFLPSLVLTLVGTAGVIPCLVFQLCCQWSWKSFFEIILTLGYSSYNCVSFVAGVANYYPQFFRNWPFK